LNKGTYPVKKKLPKNEKFPEKIHKKFLPEL
jgi:hypothetical protein